ncbi:MAG: hypothetical protein RL038_647, partial [Actinomycetota bacterium]
MKAKFAGALAVVLMLAGCSAVNESGMAAIVGEKRLSVADVAAIADEVQTTLAESDQAPSIDTLLLNQTTVTLFVRYEISKIMATALKVEATKSQIDKEYAVLVQSQGGENNLAQSAALSNIAPSYLRKYLESQLNFNNSIAS